MLTIAPERLLTPGTQSPRVLGRAGERLAEKYLQKKGHRILSRNLFHPAAELDLISLTPTHLVVTEVKTGFCSNAELERRFPHTARERQRMAARGLARRFQRSPRLDLIMVRVEPHSARIRLTHRAGV